jgi:transaldolase
MKFFLDTANLDEIRQAAALGLCDGVTTNRRSSRRKATSISSSTLRKFARSFPAPCRPKSRLKIKTRC